MSLPIQSVRSFKHKPADLVLLLKTRLSCLQFLWREVGLNVGDLDVGVLLVEARGILLKVGGRETERGVEGERERKMERERGGG